MNILVVGAGAIGGYFGARLLQARRDVSFLVRPRRADELRERGLTVKSPLGDLVFMSPPTLLTAQLKQPFDLIILSCKAYDLDDAIASFAPAVGPDTTILPLLNGMAHLDALDRRFGAGRVIGGLCIISSTLDGDGRILHLNNLHSLTFGERDGGRSRRIEEVSAVLTNATFDARLSPEILQEMWEKWVFIASAAAINCLMRASIGEVMTAGGRDFVTRMLKECAAVAADNGFEPRATAMERSTAMLTAEGSPLAASMLRDIERGARTEADHILGDLLKRSKAPEARSSPLGTAFLHLKAYEARRLRETT
jgi:2-dehydropantoate 2-reductase